MDSLDKHILKQLTSRLHNNAAFKFLNRLRIQSELEKERLEMVIVKLKNEVADLKTEVVKMKFGSVGEMPISEEEVKQVNIRAKVLAKKDRLFTQQKETIATLVIRRKEDKETIRQLSNKLLDIERAGITNK